MGILSLSLNKRMVMSVLVLCLYTLLCRSTKAIDISSKRLSTVSRSLFDLKVQIPSDDAEKSVKTMSSADLALKSPSFKNTTFPHLLLGDFINAGMFKSVFHLKFCPDPLSPCVKLRNPETSAPLIIKLSGAKPGDTQFHKDAVAHMQAEADLSTNIRRITANYSSRAKKYLDISPDHGFTFTSKELLDSPSAEALSCSKNESAQRLLRGYEHWYGSDFRFHASMSDLTDNSPLNFSSYEALAKYFKDVLRGLDIMHSMQLAHCDVKRLNVRTTVSGSAILTDFGISAKSTLLSTFRPSSLSVNRMSPPEDLMDIGVVSTYASHDIFAVGMMLLDWLYYPFVLNFRGNSYRSLSTPQKSLLRQQFARTHFILHDVTLLTNGVDVRDRFSDGFLRHINKSRNASVHVSAHDDAPGLVRSMLSFRNKTDQRNSTLPEDSRKEGMLLDLALRLTAADSVQRISIQQALKHAAFSSL